MTLLKNLFGLNKFDKERILKSFPESIIQDVNKVIEIIPTSHNIVVPKSWGLSDAIGERYKVKDLISSEEQSFRINNKIVNIPYRVHFNFPDEKALIQLTDLQQTILNCIYTRHHDGFVRQKRLESLIVNSNSFIIPFTLQLLGEYVVEILEILEKHINRNTIDDYVIFILENPKFWIKTKSRVISYWNEYYRRPQQPHLLPPKYPELNDYIGQHIVNQLETHLKRPKVT